MIRRPPRSTRVRSSAASDVYKRQTVKMLVPSRGLTRLSPIVEVDESEETEVKERACRYIDQQGDADHRVAGDELCYERACRQTELHQSGSEPHNDVSAPVLDAEPHVEHTSESSQQNLWEPGVLQRAQQGDPDIAYVYSRISAGEAQPSWDDISAKSRDTKTLLSFWSRLSIRDGILVRKFEVKEGREYHYQVILPKVLREQFLEMTHAGAAGHLVSRNHRQQYKREPTGPLGHQTWLYI